jgi:hypothetical protein
MKVENWREWKENEEGSNGVKTARLSVTAWRVVAEDVAALTSLASLVYFRRRLKLDSSAITR